MRIDPSVEVNQIYLQTYDQLMQSDLFGDLVCRRCIPI